MTPDQERTIYDHTMKVLDEDIRMIEGQQKRFDPNFKMIDINEDAGQISMRATLDQLIAEEQKTAWFRPREASNINSRQLSVNFSP